MIAMGESGRERPSDRRRGSSRPRDRACARAGDRARGSGRHRRRGWVRRPGRWRGTAKSRRRPRRFRDRCAEGRLHRPGGEVRGLRYRRHVRRRAHPLLLGQQPEHAMSMDPQAADGAGTDGSPTRPATRRSNQRTRASGVTGACAPIEAVVYIGPTPPELDYYSYRSYIAIRYFPKEGRARRVFASLGDTINHLDIKTTGTPDGAQGKPFGQTTVIITTADKCAQRDARRRRGTRRRSINTDVIPSGSSTCGLDAHSDTFTFGPSRGVLQGQAGRRRVRLVPRRARSFASPRRRRRRLPTCSPFLSPSSRSAAPATRESSTSRRPSTGCVTRSSRSTARSAPQSCRPACGSARATIQRGIDVIGENRDTIYLRLRRLRPRRRLRRYLIVYGVNHARPAR